MGFFDKPIKKLSELKNLDRDALLYKVMPHFIVEIIANYFRIEIEGLDNIPHKGRAVLTPNHSGYMGFDAAILSHEIFKHNGRIPKVLTHHLWFLTETTAIPMEKLGFIEATSKNGISHLKKNDLVVLFPEGEFGNFKPTIQAYKLQEFKRGFVRMALATKSPIIPTLIIGAEETHINLRQLKFTKYLRGLVLPLPLNVLPLPAKWKIKFLEPLYLPYKPEAINDKELVHEIASDVRERMQRALNTEIQKRKTVYL